MLSWFRAKSVDVVGAVVAMVAAPDCHCLTVSSWMVVPAQPGYC